MFTINKQKVVLSNGDTLDTIKNKIAVSLGTVPQLISDIPPIEKGGNYTIPEPLFYIRNGLNIRMVDGSPVAWNNVKNVEFDHNLLKKLYIISMIQTTIEDFGSGISNEDAVSFALLELQRNPDFLEEIYNENVWSKKNETIAEFENMVKQNQEKLTKQIKVLDTWNDICPQFQTTGFVLSKINHQTIVPNTLKQNELMVFDSLNLNDTIVACFYQEMIKYNEKYTHLIDDYLNQDKIFSKKLQVSDIIRIMVSSNQNNIKTKYRMVNVFVEPETLTFSVEGTISTTTLAQTDNGYNDFKELVKAIILNIGENNGYQQAQEKEFFYGSYTASVNTLLLVLKDLVTTDPTVYHLCYINESALINTRRTNLNLYLKSEAGQRSKDIGFSLFERHDTVGTLVRLKKIRGGPDLKSRIKQYIDKINKILQYTVLKTQTIIDFYRTYINLNVAITTFKIQNTKENNLRLQAPDIFVANYTRLCNKPPIIVDGCEDQIEDDTILKFPIYGESEPRYYMCPYSGYKYPGLRENTKLVNKQTFPFVPCCYQRPQKRNKNFRLYYNQEVYHQRINAKEIGKSLKILAPDRLGVLPPKIDRLLLYTTKVKFYRYGIPFSPSSCLLILNKVTDNHESIKTIRFELSQRAELCKGELRGMSVKEIAEMIMDPTTFISPKLFKGALEDYYNISYILFSITDDFVDSQKDICPFKKRVVLMVEHETGKHVELIVDEETSSLVNRYGKNPVYSMDVDNPILIQIQNLYKQRFRYTIYDVENKNFVEYKTFMDPLNHPWKNNSNIKLLNQHVDFYGNTRLIEFQVNGLNFVGEFPPLTCITLPLKNIKYFKLINEQLTPKQKQYLVDKFSWLKLYHTELILDSGYISPYIVFDRMRKLAEYLLWAACHYYSLYTIDTGKTVDDWINDRTLIIENFDYSKVNIRPIFIANELMVDDKFIFNSIQFQERVRFNLSLISSVNLRIYSINIYENFYKDVSNFKVDPPAQLALSKKEYFQRTRKPYNLNILTTAGIQYIQTGVLYYIKELLGVYSNILCLFFTSLENLIDTAGRLIGQPLILGESRINITIFNQETFQTYTLGIYEPQINTIALNVNSTWFYGLLLPEMT